MMVPEHTWGLDVKTHLADWHAYDRQSFGRARSRPAIKKMEASWAEQRAYLADALAALDGGPLAEEARSHLSALDPRPPDLDGFARADDTAAHIATPHFTLGFDAASGAITHLRSTARGRNWASAENPLALIRYQTFSAGDYRRFWEQYIINKAQTADWSMFWEQYIINKAQTADWSIPDFTKPGLEHANPESRFWPFRLAALYRRCDDTGQRFILDLAAQDESSQVYGCPRRVTVEINVPSAAPDLEPRILWFDKTASRLPEALWCCFVPCRGATGEWSLEKLGQPVDPNDVVHGGNRRLHAVGAGVAYLDAEGRLAIDSLDAPLVAPGEPSLLNGMHFNLYNNVWGTNFPMWYGDDALFRFRLRFT